MDLQKTLRPSSGHILDLDPAEIADGYLTRAHNVHTRKGFPSRIAGRRIVYPGFTGTDDPWHLLNIELNGFTWWMVCGAQHVWAVEAASVTEITASGAHTVPEPSAWSSTVLNTIPVLNNGADPPQYWSGFAADDLLPLPAWPAGTVCKFIVAFKYHLFALNIDGPSGTFANLVMHSDAAEPGALPVTWAAGGSNEAGSFALSDTPGRCIAGAPLGQLLFVYKPASTYAIEYVGQQPDNIFSQRTLSRAFGIYGPHCIADLGTAHFIVGTGDVVLNDGVNFRSIADSRVKRSLIGAIDETYTENMYVVRDLERREVWVCIPEQGNRFCTLAHIWDERRDTWVTRDLVQSRYGTAGYVADTAPSAAWDADSEVWDADVSTWNSGDISSVSRVVTAQANTLYGEDTTDAVSINANLQKLDLNFDADDQRKFINRVWIRGTGLNFSTVQFRLGFRDSTDASITWQTFVALQPEGTPVEITGRYISIEITSTSVQPYTLDRIRFAGRYCGAH